MASFFPFHFELNFHAPLYLFAVAHLISSDFHTRRLVHFFTSSFSLIADWESTAYTGFFSFLGFSTLPLRQVCAKEDIVSGFGPRHGGKQKANYQACVCVVPGDGEIISMLVVSLWLSSHSFYN